MRWFALWVVMGALGCAGSSGLNGTPSNTAGSGGSTAHAGSGGSAHPAGSGSVAGRGPNGCSLPEPIEHRASAETCDQTRPAGDVDASAADRAPSVPLPAGSGGAAGGAPSMPLPAGTGGTVLPPGACSSDAQCVDGANGRCEDFRGDRHCTYDECFSDSECSTGGPCGCERAFWSDANSCLQGDCQTDSDCGAGGFCSPTFDDCGNYSGVVGYYCHTCEDECTDDADCVDPTMGPGYCKYSAEVAHWVCGYSHCVG